MSHKYLNILLTFLVIGCSHVGKTQTEISKVKRTGIKNGEAIVLLSETKTFWGYDEKKLGKCTARAFEKLNRNIKIFPSDKFRRIYFSNHNLSEDYSTKEALHSIFTNKEILKRIESSNIHYLILARLDTQDYVYNRMDILIYAEAHAKEETRVFGEVYDIKQKSESGEIATHVNAKWVNRAIMHLPGQFILPIYIGYGSTESEACKAFGEEVAKFLIGEEASDYTKAIELNPTRIKDRYDRAISDFNQAIELNPENALNYFNRGNAYSHKGQYDKAISDYSQAIELNPEFAQIYNNRGIAFGKKGQFDKAISDYNKAIELKYVGAYINRGLAFYRREEYDKAISDYSKTIELINPKIAVDYQMRGYAYFLRGWIDEAISDYNKAVELDPENAQTYQKRGLAYRELAQYDKAISDYNKAIELDPENAQTYRRREEAYFMKIKYEEAYEQVYKKKPR